MKASADSLARKCLARLKAVLTDDDVRCSCCGVCHNICSLMGRKPGWFHQNSTASAPGNHALAGICTPVSIDAKAQED